MRKGILDGLTGKLKIKTGENNFVKQFNYGAAIPSIGSKADQWVSLPKNV